MEGPQLPPDGFYWDGQRWAPVPVTAAPRQKRSELNSCVGWGCLILAGLVALVAVAAVFGPTR